MLPGAVLSEPEPEPERGAVGQVADVPPLGRLPPLESPETPETLTDEAAKHVQHETFMSSSSKSGWLRWRQHLR